MDSNVEDYVRALRLADCLRTSVLRRAIRGLELFPGARVLDAGCGIGSNIPLIIEETGGSAHVTGLDVSKGLLDEARRDLAACGLEGRVSLVLGDLNDMPFAEGEFDCVISVDCAGYPSCVNPGALLSEFKRVAGPGGKIALIAWTAQQLLPGYPGLEAKLNTLSSLVTTPPAGSPPEAHFMRAAGWMRLAGLEDVRCVSYAGDISGPLDAEGREAVCAFFDMLWNRSRPALSSDEWKLYSSITDPGSPEFLPARPDYCGFFLYTCFVGRLP